MSSIVSAKSWSLVRITVIPEAADAIEHYLSEAGSLGTEIQTKPDRPLEPITITGYFDSFPDELTMQEDLYFTLRAFGFDQASIANIERTTIEDADWLAEWKKHWKPTVIGNFVIAPPWETVDEKNKTVIRIEPNMAFGTGTHETTQLCLKAIEENYTPGESFLDVGTGTGILAIAAAKLSHRMEHAWLPNEEGGPRALAIDTDELAVAIARENAELNGVSEHIEFAVGAVSDDTPDHDFVCANLTLDVILPVLPLLLAKTRRVLILSGILVGQQDAILTQLEKLGVKAPAVEQAGEWIAVLIEIEAA